MKEIALLGPKNTYHDIARQKYLPGFQPMFFKTFNEIFAALKAGKVTKALVAVRNSASGLVGSNTEDIKKNQFTVVSEFNLPIHLYLGSSFPNTLKSIKKIYSHPMAIKETQRFFRKYSHITFIASASTAGAIDEMKNNNEPTSAVISSKEAMDYHKLVVISEKIEDEPNNTTTFQLIEKGQ